MVAVSRSEAISIGEKTYFTGRSCVNNHVCLRIAQNAHCVMCKKESKAEYYRKNKNRVTAANKKNVEKNRERVRARKKKWHADNRLRCRVKIREWIERNKERYNELSRLHTQKRRSLAKQNGGILDPSDVQKLYVKQRGMCAYNFCKKSLKNCYHIDHIIPLALGGRHDRRNVQLLCPPCNREKGAIHPIEFAQKNGLLL